MPIEIANMEKNATNYKEEILSFYSKLKRTPNDGELTFINTAGEECLRKFLLSFQLQYKGFARCFACEMFQGVKDGMAGCGNINPPDTIYLTRDEVLQEECHKCER